MEIINLTPYDLVYEKDNVEFIISREDGFSIYRDLISMEEMEDGNIEIKLGEVDVSFSVPIYRKVINFIRLEEKDGRYYIIDEDTVIKWVDILNKNFFNEKFSVIKSIFDRNDFLVVRFVDVKGSEISDDETIYGTLRHNVRYVEKFYFISTLCNLVSFPDDKNEFVGLK